MECMVGQASSPDIMMTSGDACPTTDVLTGRLYVSPCLLVIDKSTKVTEDVASHCPPLAGD